MIIPDKKKAVQVILSKMGADGEESSAPVLPESPVDDREAPLDAIAEDAMLAFKNGSVQGLKEAFKAFFAEMQNASGE